MHILTLATCRRLVDINAAYSAHRHDTWVCASELLHHVGKEVNGFVNVAGTVCEDGMDP